jgi:Ser/Thr protein kinase RdoA (MazF antagonist)
VERAPWIGQHPKPPRFARAVRAADLLTGTIDDEVAARVVRTLEAFAERRRELVRTCTALPVVFCHGDPSPGNIHTGSRPVVLLD